MTIDEAIKWLNPESRELKIQEIENANDVDTIDIIVNKINEACKLACEALKLYKQT